MKTFRTEQIRLNGILLTGNATNGTLWYNQVQLAAGQNAANQATELLPGSGLFGKQNATYLYEAGVNGDNPMDLGSDMEMHISGRSGISVHNDYLWIDVGAVENNQLANNDVDVVPGTALSSSQANGTIALGGTATLNVKVDDASIEVPTAGANADKLQLKDGLTARDGTELLQGIQESHLQSVDWAKGAAHGGDALAVEHSLSNGTNMDSFSFDGSANVTANVKTAGANLVVVSGAAASTQVVGGIKTWEDLNTFEGNVVIEGQLEVQGDTIQVESNQVNIGDNIIVLNADLDTATSPENGGIDVRIGTLEGTSAGLLGGPARIWFNTDAGVRAWQAGNVKDWGTSTEDITDMHTIHTQKYSRSFGLDCIKDDDNLVVNFGAALGQADNSFAFPSIPNVVATLRYTAVDGDSGWTAEPEQVTHIIKEVSATGCLVDFSAAIPTTDYELNIHASTL